MKKILAVLLAVSLLLGISCAAAEEQATAGDFLQPLARWAQSLNLDESDYYGSVGWAGGLLYDGTIRKNQDFTELAVSGLGRAQISRKKIMLEIGGQKYGIDLTAVVKDLLQSFASGGRSFTKDLKVLWPWAEKAFKDILLPCVRISYSIDGLTLHIDANDEEIKERTYAFIDEIMAERNTAEALLSHFGSFLGRFIPGMPKTVDELERFWESEKANQTIAWRKFNFSADITCSMKFSGQSVSGHGNLYLEGLYGATISFELKSDKEGVDLLGSLDLTNDRAGMQSSSYKLALHLIGDKAEGLLQIQDNTYALKAEKETPEKGAARYTASLVGMNRQNKVFAMYDLEASFDPDNKSVGISLYETRNAGTSSESRERVAGLDLYKGILGWEAELKLPFEDLSVNLSRGDRYCRLRLEYTSATESRSWYLDTWLYYSPGEYLIKAETNLFDLYNDNERNIYTVSLAARKHEIEYSVSDGLETKCHAKLSYNRTGNGFEAEAEYLNLWAPDPVFNTWKKPSRLKLVREGNSYRADLEWCRESKTEWSATGILDFDPTGGFGKLEIDATQYDLAGDRPEKSYRLSYVPGAITYADKTGAYELRITENTAEKMVFSVTKDEKYEMASLTLTLDDQGAFNAAVGFMGFEMGNMTIKPIPKEPVDEITEENALMIGLTNLSELLHFGSTQQ